VMVGEVDPDSGGVAVDGGDAAVIPMPWATKPPIPVPLPDEAALGDPSDELDTVELPSCLSKIAAGGTGTALLKVEEVEVVVCNGRFEACKEILVTLVTEKKGKFFDYRRFAKARRSVLESGSICASA
jgi:hypothetical protein